MSYNTLTTLAELHFELGLIGIAELSERCDVAAWVFDNSRNMADPRSEGREYEEGSEEPREPETLGGARGSGGQSDEAPPDFLHFSYLTWVFTKSDPDPYPSTPHGHWQHQNNPWPKLDPYVGRAFDKKHNECISKRLTKNQLRDLWSDERFRDFCRSHIVWYMEEFQYHRFRVAHPFRFPRY